MSELRRDAATRSGAMGPRERRRLAGCRGPRHSSEAQFAANVAAGRKQAAAAASRPAAPDTEKSE